MNLAVGLTEQHESRLPVGIVSAGYDGRLTRNDLELEKTVRSLKIFERQQAERLGSLRSFWRMQELFSRVVLLSSIYS